MSVNGIQNRPSSMVGTQSQGPVLHSSSGPESQEPVDETSPGVETGAEEGFPTDTDTSMEEPSPDGDPAARAAWLEAQVSSQQELYELREELEYLASRGDSRARELLSKLDASLVSPRQLEKWQNELDTLADYAPDEDLDGDGIINRRDVDMDGDGITAEAEQQNGTSDSTTDSDGDGITDYGELWLKQNNYDYAWMDATNPDANHNGILDGRELPASVLRNINSGNATSGSGGASGIQWGPPAADAHQAQWGQPVPGTGDVVVTLNGENVEISTSSDGKDLIVTDTATGQSITIPDYKSRKVFFEGTAGTIKTINLGASQLGPKDTTGDGYADTGVHFGSGINISGATTQQDPLNGSGTINEAESTADETVYESGATGEFQIPEEINGVPVGAVELVREGDDIIVVLKDSPDGEALHRFRLKGAGGHWNYPEGPGRPRPSRTPGSVETGELKFRLADTGQYFYSSTTEAHVIGGKGDDYITIKGGSATGGEGNDILRAIDEAATLDGGKGDDILEGGSGVDTLIGGSEDEGMDMIFSGSSEGDTLDGGDGDDVLIVDNTQTNAHYTIRGGAGQDMTNATNRDVVNATDAGIEVDVSNPAGIFSYLQQHQDGAAGDLAQALQGSEEDLNQAADMAGSMIGDAARALLSRKKADRYAAFNSSSGLQDSGDGMPAPEDEEDI